MESSTYKAIFAEGARKGLELMKRTCLHMVEAKLGALPAEATVIEQIDDLDVLDLLTSRLIEAASPEAVRAALRSLKD
jgi:hypothetical protein